MPKWFKKVFDALKEELKPLPKPVVYEIDWDKVDDFDELKAILRGVHPKILVYENGVLYHKHKRILKEQK